MSVPISARKDGTNIIHCTGPDVCKTPIGSSMVPVPYMSMVTLGGAIRTSKTGFSVEFAHEGGDRP